MGAAPQVPAPGWPTAHLPTQPHLEDWGVHGRPPKLRQSGTFLFLFFKGPEAAGPSWSGGSGKVRAAPRFWLLEPLPLDTQHSAPGASTEQAAPTQHQVQKGRPRQGARLPSECS